MTDRKKVLDQLRTLYAKDYINEWRSFLAAASVERFSSLSEGARKLAPLSGNQSPLLAMFSAGIPEHGTGFPAGNRRLSTGAGGKPSSRLGEVHRSLERGLCERTGSVAGFPRAIDERLAGGRRRRGFAGAE